jgi:N-acetylglutamate synthase-like GNAT family acetyltransferase
VQVLTVNRLADVCDIDMRERGDIVYRVSDGCLRADLEEWTRPPRTQETWNRFIEEWTQILHEGGQAWGAYTPQHRMVGIIVLRHRLTEAMDQLAALFVSRNYRRTGIARELTRRLIQTARASGARRVYVSATPSPSAVGFYRSQGFALADTVHPELFAREPEDIHLVLEL